MASVRRSGEALTLTEEATSTCQTCCACLVHEHTQCCVVQVATVLRVHFQLNFVCIGDDFSKNTLARQILLHVWRRKRRTDKMCHASTSHRTSNLEFVMDERIAAIHFLVIVSRVLSSVTRRALSSKTQSLSHLFDVGQPFWVNW